VDDRVISTVALGFRRDGKGKGEGEGARTTYTYVIALKIKRAKENTYARENWGGMYDFRAISIFLQMISINKNFLLLSK